MDELAHCPFDNKTTKAAHNAKTAPISAALAPILAVRCVATSVLGFVIFGDVFSSNNFGSALIFVEQLAITPENCATLTAIKEGSSGGPDDWTPPSEFSRTCHVYNSPNLDGRKRQLIRILV